MKGPPGVRKAPAHRRSRVRSRTACCLLASCLLARVTGSRPSMMPGPKACARQRADEALGSTSRLDSKQRINYQNTNWVPAGPEIPKCVLPSPSATRKHKPTLDETKANRSG